jgi:Phage-related protein
VTFNCKPHKYRQDGEHIITLTASENTLTNCENAEALPLIRVYPTTTGGVSVFNVNGVSCTILSVPEYIDIDCEMMNAYYGTTNCNNKLSGLNFPVLVSGTNSINLTTNILKIELKPRWRAI